MKVYYEQPGHNPQPALFVTGRKPGHTRKEGHNFFLRRSIDTTMVLGKSYVSISTSLSPTKSRLLSRVQASNRENPCNRCQCDEAMYLKFILCSVFGECTSQHCFLNQMKNLYVKIARSDISCEMPELILLLQSYYVSLCLCIKMPQFT